ncbi:MAG: glycosyltransferase family 2 protein [Sulfuricella sp.]|nr:glycosyltransferase family 2 protein [Sulfuricella sp.]
MLSVVVITKNEAGAIRDCLESVAWADEIVVLDSGSSDETVAICREYGAIVQITDWPGFGPQKNRALSLATGDWVLSLDADERVTPELCREIEAAMAGPDKYEAFRIPRSSSYCGRFMRHGGWWPDYVTRLFRKGSAHFTDDLVHERLEVAGATGTLSQPLLHIAFTDPEEVLDKVNRYSSAGAAMQYARGRNASLGSAVLHGLWSFLRTYVLRAGFLDGREGFMLAVSNAEGTYYRYLKLMLLAERK